MKIYTEHEELMRKDMQKNGLLQLINFLGNNKEKDMIEIGSFLGESTILFAQSFNSVTAIDPFVSGYDNNDPASYDFNYENIYDIFKKRTSKYPNIKHIKSTSDEAYEALKPNYAKFDFIYIDGIHTYEGVKKDIQNYIHLVKPGGIIGGHDYNNTSHVAGVYKAVNEMFGRPDNTFEDTSWIKFIN